MLPEFVKDRIASRIAGEIVLSKRPGEAMKKWRQIFNVKQLELAGFLGFSPSVISDYEGGRRKSPGSQVIRRFVLSLIKIDEIRGGDKLRELAQLFFPEFLNIALIDIGEFPNPHPIKTLVEVLDATVLYGDQKLFTSYVYGYTVIDSIEAIKRLSGDDYLRFYGMTTQRILVFTNVKFGRSPMVAIRVRGLKPTAVAIHGPEEVDPLAIELAKIEDIPLLLSRKPSVDDIVKGLRAILREGSPERP